MKFRSAWLILSCFAWAGSATLASAQTIIDGVPEGFEFVRLTNNNMKEGVPSINNRSEVAYSVFLPPNVADIYTFSGGIVSRITTDETYDLAAVINDSSQIAWGAGTNDNDPTFDIVSNYFDGAIQGSHYPSGFIAINDLGDLAWISRPLSGGKFNIFLYRHAIADVEQVTFFGDNQQVQINSMQNLAWTQEHQNLTRPMFYSKGEVTSLGPCNGTCWVDLNDHNQVLWTEPTSLVVWSRQSTFIIPTGTAVNGPRINNNGTIALGLWDSRLQRWMHSVYKNGTIYRMPDIGLSASRATLNDLDEVAMKYLDLRTGLNELYLLRKAMPKGDFDGDCDLDLVDRALMTHCITGAGAEVELLADCTRADFDEDGDVDKGDEALFAESMTGLGVKIKGCAPGAE